MPNYIQSIALSTGTYAIKDAEARTGISNLSSAVTSLSSKIDVLSKATKWLGITTTELTDGATTNPITINGESVTAEEGNITGYDTKEFIFNGTAWQEFGSLDPSAFGDLAFKDSASTSYTPEGTVTISVPNLNGSVTVLSASAASVSYTIYTPNRTASIYGFASSTIVSQETLIFGATVDLAFTSAKTADLTKFEDVNGEKRVTVNGVALTSDYTQFTGSSTTITVE